MYIYIYIYMQFSIIYYILLLSIVIVLAIKAVGFSKARQTLSNIFCNVLFQHQKLNMKFFIWIFYNFRLKDLLLHVLKDEESRKTFIWFHVLNILKKFPYLRKSHVCFSNRIKTTQHVMPSLVLGELKVFNGLLIHP